MRETVIINSKRFRTAYTNLSPVQGISRINMKNIFFPPEKKLPVVLYNAVYFQRRLQVNLQEIMTGIQIGNCIGSGNGTGIVVRGNGQIISQYIVKTLGIQGTPQAVCPGKYRDAVRILPLRCKTQQDDTHK
jgi:hypothetical protein